MAPTLPLKFQSNSSAYSHWFQKSPPINTQPQIAKKMNLVFFFAQSLHEKKKKCNNRGPQSEKSANERLTTASDNDELIDSKIVHIHTK